MQIRKSHFYDSFEQVHVMVEIYIFGTQKRNWSIIRENCLTVLFDTLFLSLSYKSCLCSLKNLANKQCTNLLAYFTKLIFIPATQQI